MKTRRVDWGKDSYPHIFIEKTFRETVNKYMSDWAQKLGDRLGLIPNLRFFYAVKKLIDERTQYEIFWFSNTVQCKRDSASHSR